MGVGLKGVTLSTLVDSRIGAEGSELVGRME